jgi:hypothetical protein
MAGAAIASCPPAEVDITPAHTTADRDTRMADPGINRDMQGMATDTQARVPARPMPVHDPAVDDQAAAIMAVAVDDPAGATAADGPAAVKVAGITVTEHPL